MEARRKVRKGHAYHERVIILYTVFFQQTKRMLRCGPGRSYVALGVVSGEFLVSASSFSTVIITFSTWSRKPIQVPYHHICHRTTYTSILFTSTSLSCSSVNSLGGSCIYPCKPISCPASLTARICSGNDSRVCDGMLKVPLMSCFANNASRRSSPTLAPKRPREMVEASEGGAGGEVRSQGAQQSTWIGASVWRMKDVWGRLQGTSER